VQTFTDSRRFIDKLPQGATALRSQNESHTCRSTAAAGGGKWNMMLQDLLDPVDLTHLCHSFYSQDPPVRGLQGFATSESSSSLTAAGPRPAAGHSDFESNTRRARTVTRSVGGNPAHAYECQTGRTSTGENATIDDRGHKEIGSRRTIFPPACSTQIASTTAPTISALLGIGCLPVDSIREEAVHDRSMLACPPTTDHWARSWTSLCDSF